MANRFTPIQQPLVFDPISIEQFAMVPLAEAEAKAAGIKAASTYTLDYNVDIKDQQYISGVAKDIEDRKNNIVTRVMSEGISDNLITEFMSLKKEYTGAKKSISMAEENKARIEKWKQEVLQLHQNDPSYLEFIKDKEYTKGWQGTFKEDGSNQVFDANRGPKSYSFVEDAIDIFSGISTTLTKDIAGGGRYAMEKLPDGRQVMVYISSNGKKEYSNKSNILKRMEAVIDEYANELSPKGSYRAYRELPMDEVIKIYNDVAQSMIKEDVRGGGTSKQFIPSVDKKPDIDHTSIIRSPVTRKDFKIKEPEAQTYNSTVRGTLTWLAGVGEAAIGKEEREKKKGWWEKRHPSLKGIGFTGVLGPLGLPTGIMAGLYKQFTTEASQEAFNKASEDAKAIWEKGTQDTRAWKSDIGKTFLDNYYLGIEEQSTIQDKYGIDFALHPSDERFRNKLKEFELEMNKKGLKDDDRYIKFYENVLLPYIDNDVKTMEKEITYSTEEALVNKKLKLNNDPKGYIRDAYNKIDVGLNKADMPYYNFLTRKPVTEDELANIKEAMGNFASGKEIPSPPTGDNDEAYFMKLSGIAGADPDMYTDSQGNQIRNIMNGGLITITEINQEGEQVTTGTYLVGPEPGYTGLSEYKTLENKIEKLTDVQLGDVVPIKYMQTTKKGTLQAVDAVIERSIYPEYAFDLEAGEMVLIPKGNLSINVFGEDGFRFKYNQQYLNRLVFPKTK